MRKSGNRFHLNFPPKKPLQLIVYYFQEIGSWDGRKALKATILLFWNERCTADNTASGKNRV